MPQITVSKSQFKPKALEYFRLVEKKKKTLVITHNKKPIAKIIPYEEENDEEILKQLRGTVTYYKNPTQPVGAEDWEVLKK